MSDLIKLELVDVDGAVREAEDAVAGDTRASFFKKGALAGGAVLGSGVIMGGFPQLAAAKPSKKQDVAILNYALTLEYLEAAFYNEALAKNILSGQVLAAAKIVTKHENTHVKFLKKTLGKAAVKSPKFDFGTANDNQKNFLATAVVLEDVGVSAYAGQGPRIKQTAVIKAALSIHSVEARHAAYLRSLNGQNFAPNAFDPSRSISQVLKKAKPFIK